MDRIISIGTSLFDIFNININLEKLISTGMLFMLVLFPFVAYVFIYVLKESPGTLLSLIYGSSLFFIILNKYRRNEAIRFPIYIQLLGLFAFYDIISVIFMTEQLEQRGFMRVAFYNGYFRAFMAFLLLENLTFKLKELKLAVYVIIAMIFISAAVMIRQLSDPLYFLNLNWFFFESVFSSVEEIKYAVQHTPYLLNHAARVIFLEGYRFSIYSWVSVNSIGTDFIGMFILVYAMKYVGTFWKTMLNLLTGLTSFLCMSRYVLLNYFVVSAYTFFVKGRIDILVKYLFGGVTIIVLFYFTAPLIGFDVDAFIEERLMAESAETRLYAFEMFGQVYPLRPIFGTAGQNTKDMLKLAHGVTSHIHVGWLSLFYWYGIIGGSIWMIFYFSFLITLRARAVKTQYWGAFFAVVIIGVANLTQSALDTDKFGMMLAIIFSRYGHQLFNPEYEDEEGQEKTPSISD